MTRLLFLGVGFSVGLLTTTVFGQVIWTVVVEEGIDTTLAAFGLNGPDAPHGAEGTNPDGVGWEWDGADCDEGCLEGGGENHGLLWFDIPQDVLSSFGDGEATLALHVFNHGNAGVMYRMTSDWLSGPDGGDEVTFNNIPGGPGVVPGQNAEADSNATFPDSMSLPTPRVFELDVSADVRAWAAGSPNYGWGFAPVGGNGTGITSFEHARNPVPALTLTFVPEPLLLGDVNLVPAEIYDVYDDDRDLLFDDLGDAADSALTRLRRSVGEKDLNTVNRVSRLVAKFDLPEPPPDRPVLESATLRFYLDGVVGAPAGPVSLFHSRTDNDIDVLATDFEDPGYTDTLLDLIQPTDQAGQYYEVNVTDQVLADYTQDDDTLLSAFRLQVSETAFAEDDEGHLYKLTMPGSRPNRPHLALTFTTGPSLLGDVNLDGEVNGLDVDPFVDVLLNGPYQAAADLNDDLVVNGLDVDPFVAAVVGGTQQVPEPSTLLLALVALGVVGGWRQLGG